MEYEVFKNFDLVGSSVAKAFKDLTGMGITSEVFENNMRVYSNVVANELNTWLPTSKKLDGISIKEGIKYAKDKGLMSSDPRAAIHNIGIYRQAYMDYLNHLGELRADIASETYTNKDFVKGVPMFTMITLGYYHGVIKPSYTTVYGTLNLDNDDERKELLENIISDGISIYNENEAGYP